MNQFQFLAQFSTDPPPTLTPTTTATSETTTTTSIPRMIQLKQLKFNFSFNEGFAANQCNQLSINEGKFRVSSKNKKGRPFNPPPPRSTLLGQGSILSSFYEQYFAPLD